MTARILIVDDEYINRQLMESILGTFNFETITARNGQEALKLINERTPDLILVDIRMPDLDGYETTKRIKENPRTAHIPVILISGLTITREELDQAKSIGAVDVLQRGISMDKLVQTINQHLPDD